MDFPTFLMMNHIFGYPEGLFFCDSLEFLGPKFSSKYRKGGNKMPKLDTKSEISRGGKN